VSNTNCIKLLPHVRRLAVAVHDVRRRTLTKAQAARSTGIMSAQKLTRNPQPGHLAYASQQAAEELARGQQQGWAANAQVYEAMITALCDKDHLSDAIDTFNRMKVPPRMRAEDSPDKQLCIRCPASARAPPLTQQ
jgi:pentatricopeptide repeat protein